MTALAREEELLTAAVERLHRLVEVIRSGVLNQLVVCNWDLESLDAAIREAAAERDGAIRSLSDTFAEPTKSLREIAARCSEPWASQLLGLRARLAALAAEFQTAQRRAAILTSSVRSYFQSVLSAMTEERTTMRYGRTGTRIRP